MEYIVIKTNITYFSQPAYGTNVMKCKKNGKYILMP
jgi:hypothetical protein